MIGSTLHGVSAAKGKIGQIHDKLQKYIKSVKTMKS